MTIRCFRSVALLLLLCHSTTTWSQVQSGQRPFSLKDFPGYNERLKPALEALDEASSPIKPGSDSVYSATEVAERRQTYLLATEQFVVGQRLWRAGNPKEASVLMRDALEEWESLGLKTPITVFPRYGQLLLQLNQIFSATQALEKGLAIEQAAQISYEAGDRRPKEYFLGLAMIQAKSQLQINSYAAKLGQGFVFERSGDQIAFDDRNVWKPLQLSSSQLLDAYSRSRNTKAAYALYDGLLSDFLKYELAWFDPDGRNGYWLREAVCTSAAISLARLGQNQRVDKAFQCALQNHWTRATNEARVGGSAPGIQGNAIQHRLLVGAYLDYLSRSALSKDQESERKSLVAIIESKGLAQRYLQSRSSYVASQTGPQADRLRESIRALERSATELPTVGRPVIEAYTQWLYKERSTYFDVHQQMVANDLSEVFINGGRKLDDIQASLRNEAVIGYFIYAPIDETTGSPGDRKVLRYLVWDKGIDLLEIGSLKEIDRLIFSVRRGDKSASQELSMKLLGQLPAPVSSASRWTIDPDGSLNLLPFEALSLPDGKLVLDRYITRYITALSILGTAQRSQASSRNTALLLADPEYPNQGEWDTTQQASLANIPTTRGASLKDTRLVPLPETSEEAKSIATSLMQMGVTSELKLGAQANVDALAFRSAPRFLHIAAHGLFLVPTPARSEGDYADIALTLPELQAVVVLSKSEEGSLLTGLRLSQLPLQGTELVVLSACDTGNGSAEVGEGMAGLRRSIETAGARSSVTSLWPVPSEATKDLMENFYKNLASGMPKAEALRKAKLVVRAKNPDPKAWAGFIFAGLD